MLATEGFDEFVSSRFNWAVFANESKWYANESEQGVETYDRADALLDWCEGKGMPVRGHCVFWEPEKWQPKWVAGLTHADLKGAVERRLEHSVEHFRGRFAHWDVNNEMLHGSFFAERLGKDIWSWMHRRVRELDPDVKLFTNDFNVLSVDQDFSETQTLDYVQQIQELLDSGAPIDGVGMQGHVWHEDVLANPVVIRERLDLVASVGLPIWITEFDVAHEDQERNADILELVYRTCFEHPSVEGIVTWMPWEGDSWRGPAMGLGDLNWNPKPACLRYDALLTEWSSNQVAVTDETGSVTIEGFAGNYEMSWGEAESVRFALEAG